MNRIHLLCAIFLSAASLVADPSKGLLAHYTFDGVLDDTNGATLATDRFGSPNQACYLGKNNFIQTPIQSNGNTLSISVWFMTMQPTKMMTIVDSDVSGQYGRSIMLNYDGTGQDHLDNHISLQFHNWATAADAAIKGGVWYHAVAVYSAGTYKLYLDGVLIVAGNETGSVDGSNFRFGKHSSPMWFEGAIDEVRFYGRPLGDTEVMELYSAESGNITIEEPSVAPKTLYQYIQVVPPGFSMISVPFSFNGNNIQTLFGTNPNIVIYDYDYNGGWLVNSYDEEFEEWDVPNHAIPAGSAIWVLNRLSENTLVSFRGAPPSHWRVPKGRQ